MDWKGFATAAYELALFEDDFAKRPTFADHYALSPAAAAEGLSACRRAYLDLKPQLQRFYDSERRERAVETVRWHQVRAARATRVGT